LQNSKKLTNNMEFASKLKHSGLPLLLINQELFGKRSYNVQPKELLADIRSYKSTFDLAKELYYSIWGDEKDADHHNNWDDWWANDVYGWGNEEVATSHGYTARMYKLWEKFSPLWPDNMHAPEYFRFTQLPTGRRPLSSYKTDCFLSSYLDKKTNTRQIRSFWGAMTPSNRRDFIKNRVINHLDAAHGHIPEEYLPADEDN